MKRKENILEGFLWTSAGIISSVKWKEGSTRNDVNFPRLLSEKNILVAHILLSSRPTFTYILDKIYDEEFF